MSSSARRREPIGVALLEVEDHSRTLRGHPVVPGVVERLESGCEGLELGDHPALLVDVGSRDVHDHGRAEHHRQQVGVARLSGQRRGLVAQGNRLETLVLVDRSVQRQRGQQPAAEVGPIGAETVERLRDQIAGGEVERPGHRPPGPLDRGPGQQLGVVGSPGLVSGPIGGALGHVGLADPLVGGRRQQPHAGQDAMIGLGVDSGDDEGPLEQGDRLLRGQAVDGRVSRHGGPEQGVVDRARGGSGAAVGREGRGVRMRSLPSGRRRRGGAGGPVGRRTGRPAGSGAPARGRTGSARASCRPPRSAWLRAIRRARRAGRRPARRRRDRLQGVEVELGTDDGSDRQGLVGRIGEPGQTTADHLPHPVRDAELGQVGSAGPRIR